LNKANIKDNYPLPNMDMFSNFCGEEFQRYFSDNPQLVYSYILKATYYFTKWQEAVALKKVDSDEHIKFLKENILSRFEVPIFFYHR
jgi:hypothetical protein